MCEEILGPPLIILRQIQVNDLWIESTIAYYQLTRVVRPNVKCHLAKRSSNS